MEEKIRLYSIEELYHYGLDEVVKLFLERQTAEMKRLAEYNETSRKLTNALEEIRLLKAKLYGPSTETAGSLGIDKKENEHPNESQDTSESDCPKSVSDLKSTDGERTKERRRPKRSSGCMKKQREGLPVIDVDDIIGKKT